MVYDKKTLRPLHALTERGEQFYRQMLEDMGTEILFRHNHPIKFIVMKIVDFFKGI